MKIVSLSPLRAVEVPWRRTNGAWMSTVVVKATFALRATECVLADDQEPPNGEDSHWNDDTARSVYAPSDLAPFKPAPEVVLVGFAWSGSRSPAQSVVARLVVDELDKSIEVHCDRILARDGSLRFGAPFSRMPVRYERAAAGPTAENPVGVRMDVPDATGATQVPNIQPVGFVVASPNDKPPPVGFGPIAEAWPSRMRAVGAAGAGWLEARRQGRAAAEEVDSAFWQCAPRDQRLAQLRETASIRLEHLHPDGPRFTTRLPGARPRVFVETGDRPPQELGMACDTLWIDTDRLVATLTWRASVARDERATAYVAMDSARRPTAWADVERLARDAKAAGPRATKAPAGAGRDVPANLRSTGDTPFGPPSSRAGSPNLVTPPGVASVESWRPSSRESRHEIVAEGTRVLDGGIGLDLAAKPRSRQPSLHEIRQELGGPAVDIEPRAARVPSLHDIPPRPEPIGESTNDGEDALGLGTAILRRAAPTAQGAPSWLKGGAAPAAAPPAPPSRTGIPFSSPDGSRGAGSGGPPMPAPSVAPPHHAPPAAVGSMAPPHVPPASPPLSPLASAIAPASLGASALGAGLASRPPVVRAPANVGAMPTVPALGGAAGVPQHRPDAARAGLLGASNAAADPSMRPGSLEAPRVAFVGDILELLWFDPESLPRIRRRKEWRELLDKLDDEPFDPEVDEAVAIEDPAELEDRRDVFEVLARAGASHEGEVARSVTGYGVRAHGRFAPTMLLLHGEIRFEFDELETLRAVVSAASPFAPADPDLKAAVDGATAFAEAPNLRAAPEVCTEMTRRVREAFGQKPRGVHATYLEDQSERVLVEQRAYQMRAVFGAPHMRGLFFFQGSSTGVPTYLPEDVSEKLPLFRRLRVRLVAETHFQADQYEQHAVALRVVALARATRAG